MGIQLGSNFDVITNLSLDSRLVVADETARDAIASGVRYEGMVVYVEADEKHYSLVGGITNGDWVEFGTGGGGSGTGGKNYFDAISSDFEDGTIGGWTARGTAVANIEYFPSQNSFVIADRFAFLLPAVPANEFIQVTEAFIAVSSLAGATGTFSVSLQADNGSGNPDGTKITEIFVNASALGTTDPSNKSFIFQNQPLLATGTYWIVADFTGISGSSILYIHSTDSVPNDLLRWTGSAWAVQSGQAKGNVDYREVSASTVLTLTANTTNPLAGTTDLSLAKSAASAFNDYAVLATRTIDRADRGKPFFGSFSFDTNAANYASNDLRVEFFDVTSGGILYGGPADSLLIPKGQGKFDFVVYTESTTQQIEFRIRGNTTNATAYTVFFDEFRLGPAASVNAVYRNESTINLSSPFTGGQVRVSRIGRQIVLSAATGATFSSASSVTASGLIPVWARPSVAVQNTTANGATVISSITVGTNGDLTFEFRNYSGTATNATTIGAYTISYTVEDTSSQVLTTNELGLQRIRAKYTGCVSNIDTLNFIPMPTKVYDDFNAYNPSTGTFTVPRSGKLKINVGLRRGTTSVTINSRNSLNAFVNGVGVSIFGFNQAFATVSSPVWWVNGSCEINVNRGDQVQVRNEPNGHSAATWGGGTENFIEFDLTEDLTVLGAVRERNKVQTKVLASSVTSDGVISSLTFNNLVVGKWYEVTGQFRLAVNLGGADVATAVTATHNSVELGRVVFINRQSSSSVGDAIVSAMAFKFKASAANLTFAALSASANSPIEGNGSRETSFVQLEERNDLMETTDFT